VVTAHGVPQAEAEPANQHQAQKEAQQRAHAQCQFGIAPLLDRLKLAVVKDSPHTPSPNLWNFKKYLVFRSSHGAVNHQGVRA
jgi:hypothetical protein